MGFRDFGDLMARTGWGRSISKEEALEIAAKNEEDGLVLQPCNQQEIQAICSCCGDCCGALKAIKTLPRPAEFVASNYFAQVKADLCDGCGICVDRCQMEAVAVQDDVARVNRDRCIGCGLCVPKCPSESIHLVKKEKELVPPKDMDAMFEAIKANRI
jgi:heterodisulfide reductase subunit A-like polyferredoxin